MVAICGLPIAKYFVAVPSTGGPPSLQIDALGDESDAAIAQRNVNSTRVICSGTENAPTAGLHVGDSTLRRMVVRVAGPVLAAIDPTGTALP